MVKEYILFWNSYKSSIRTSTEIQRKMCVKLTVPPCKQKEHTYIWKGDNTRKRNGKWCWYDKFLPGCYNSVCQVSYQWSLTGCKWASTLDTDFWHRILMPLEGVILLQPSFKMWEHQLLSSCYVPASQHWLFLWWVKQSLNMYIYMHIDIEFISLGELDFEI